MLQNYLFIFLFFSKARREKRKLRKKNRPKKISRMKSRNHSTANILINNASDIKSIEFRRGITNALISPTAKKYQRN